MQLLSQNENEHHNGSSGEPNTCKLDTFQYHFFKVKSTVLVDYWELGARIETRSPGNAPLQDLQTIFEAVVSPKRNRCGSL